MSPYKKKIKYLNEKSDISCLYQNMTHNDIIIKMQYILFVQRINIGIRIGRQIL